jgi:HSP20 family protein
MSDLTVRKVSNVNDRTLPVFAAVERIMERIRQRAFERFSLRGAFDGMALDDWLAAEREFSWPAAELTEHEKDFVLSVALPGFEVGDVELTTTPREIVLHAKTRSEVSEPPAAEKGAEAKVVWSEFRSNDVYRRVELPSEIDINDVKATLKKGVLKVVATKAKERPTAKVTHIQAA